MWKMIASADENWGIGKDNSLLVQIPRDMQQFRERTLGGVVVMGRRTFESLPGGLALPERTNVILTRRKDYKARHATVLYSVEELKDFVKGSGQDIYVIGGESVYKQLLPCCDVAYITRIRHAYEADAYFPDLERDEEWELVFESEEQTYFDLEYTFCTYQRKGRC